MEVVRSTACPDCGRDMCEPGVDFAEVNDPERGRIFTCQDCSATHLARAVAARIAEHMRACGVPRRFESIVPDTIERAIWSQLEEWRGDPDTVLLWGPVGCGKSHLAACVVRELLLAGTRCLWVRVGDAVDAMRDNLDGAHGYLEKLRSVPYLVLDDLGAERQTDYAIDRVSTLVAGRWDDARATIVTTNATPTQLHDMHARMASRLLGGLVIRMTGKDRRLPGGGIVGRETGDERKPDNKRA